MDIKEKLWLLGAGRRSEKTVFEQSFFFEDFEMAALGESGVRLRETLQARIDALGIEDPGNMLGFDDAPDDPGRYFCQIFSRLAILFQQASGHRVSEYGVEADKSASGYWVWFEYEHDAVAAAAVVLALTLLSELEPSLTLPELEGEAVELQEVSWQGFLAVARPRILPLEAEAIICAAKARGIPVVNLDRAPYKGVEGPFRIRPNGLLKLGHGAAQLIVDGSICVSRSSDLLPLLRDKPARLSRLASAGVPLPVTDPEAGNCAISKHAVRSAQRIGYPVQLTVTAVNGQQFSWPDIQSETDLRNTLDQARRYGSQVDLCSSVSGANWQVLMVGTDPQALMFDGKVYPVDRLNGNTREQLQELARKLQSGILLVHLRSSGFDASLRETGGAFLDFDVAPNLGEWLGDDRETLQKVSGAFVDFLLPKGTEARIPIVTVTGTNGKTTTCRMTETIARKAGFGTGMASTGGIYYDGEKYEQLGKGGLGRQFRLFEREEVNFTVLEEYFGSIVRNGLMYDFSDVAVCTNVSEDHIGSLGVYSLEDIAATKALAIYRASRAAVLNADNALSLAMMAGARAANIGLVSVDKPAQELIKLMDRPGRVCVMESQEGEDWLVIHADNNRIPLMPVKDIPATFEGKARHNSVNAMQAALACHFMDIDIADIRSALASFQPDFESSMGRLNMMPGLPFQFLMDYAHNLDGYRVLCHFTDQLEVAGKRIVCLAFSGDRQNREIKQAVSYISSHFDLFVCGGYKGLRGRQPGEIPKLLSQYLQESGVSPDRILIYPQRNAALNMALEETRPGDLLVFLAGGTDFKKVWAKMKKLRSQFSQESS